MINFEDLAPFDDATAAFRQTFYTAFGNQMKSRREATGVSLSDLAEKLDIPEQDLAGYESGKPVPFIECVAIYKTLGMEPEVTKK